MDLRYILAVAYMERQTREETSGHSGIRRGWGRLREWHGNIHSTSVKQRASGNVLYDRGSSVTGAL